VPVAINRFVDIYRWGLMASAWRLIAAGHPLKFFVGFLVRHDQSRERVSPQARIRFQEKKSWAYSLRPPPAVGALTGGCWAAACNAESRG
jgi:hypothetical protein